MANKARWVWLPALVLAAAGGSPGRSENPRISLKLENVTPAEAAAQLGRAAGLRVDFPGTFGAALPEPAERASYDWTNTSFARALRQLCEKYNLRPSRLPGGYALYPAFNAPAAPLKRSGIVEK